MVIIILRRTRCVLCRLTDRRQFCVIKQIAGMTVRIVLYTTHVVSDIESIADEVLLIKKGKIIKKGTPSELIASLDENGKDSDLEDVYMYYFG